MEGGRAEDIVKACAVGVQRGDEEAAKKAERILKGRQGKRKKTKEEVRADAALACLATLSSEWDVNAVLRALQTSARWEERR